MKTSLIFVGTLTLGTSGAVPDATKQAAQAQSVKIVTLAGVSRNTQKPARVLFTMESVAGRSVPEPPVTSFVMLSAEELRKESRSAVRTSVTQEETAKLNVERTRSAT